MAESEVRRREGVPAKSEPESFDLIWDEARDHVFPWGRKFAQRARTAQAASIAFAFAVTVVWVLGILGHLRPAVVIGWWTAWSVFELVVRVNCKPWFRQGPLLRRMRRMRRPASRIQLAFYVLTKNVLIGALLFLVMSMVSGVPD
jgi:NosR/NirI family nitrous oxide reductase transcriptional regulator